MPELVAFNIVEMELVVVDVVVVLVVEPIFVLVVMMVVLFNLLLVSQVQLNDEYLLIPSHGSSPRSPPYTLLPAMMLQLCFRSHNAWTVVKTVSEQQSLLSSMFP